MEFSLILVVTKGGRIGVAEQVRGHAAPHLLSLWILIIGLKGMEKKSDLIHFIWHLSLRETAWLPTSKWQIKGKYCWTRSIQNNSLTLNPIQF